MSLIAAIVAATVAFIALKTAPSAPDRVTCTPGTSQYGPASGNPNAINGSKLDFSAFAGNVTLFTNVASF